MDLALGKHLRGLSGPILVTGHTGFKGTWLTLLLERIGVPVVGLSLAPLPNSLFDRMSRTGAIPEIFHDIRDFDAVEAFMQEHQPSAVIHLAAQPLVLESYQTPRETFETNVMGTVNILDASLKADSVLAIVVVTTDKVYKNDNMGRAFTESDPLGGKDPYGASKVGAEAAVAAWQQISKVSSGVKVVSVRAGNVIGGGDWAENRLMPDLIRGFVDYSKISIRSPMSTRPWQHVLDPLRGYLMTLEAILDDRKIDALNFGPGSESLTVKDVVEISIKTWKSPTSVDIDANSDDVTEATALQLNSSNARDLLGWIPKWSQSESVVATVKWWDRVLNEDVSPWDACQLDVEYLLSQ